MSEVKDKKARKAEKALKKQRQAEQAAAVDAEAMEVDETEAAAEGSSSSGKVNEVKKDKKKRKAVAEEAGEALVEVAAVQEEPEEAVVQEEVTEGKKKAKKDKKSSKKRARAADDDEAIAEEAPTAVAENELEIDLDAPAPASKKEQRKEKKRKLTLGEDAAAEEESKTSTSAAAKKVEKTEKSPYGVWIGNMSFATAQSALTKWLEAKGVANITRVHMPGGKKAHEKNRGFAYVDFSTPEDETLAVSLSEEHLEGRRLLIKSSSDYTGRPEGALPPVAQDSTYSKTERRILNSQANAPGPTLFLGNLGFDTTQDDLREMFDAHQRAAAVWEKRKKPEKREKTVKPKPADGEAAVPEAEEDSEQEELDSDPDSDPESGDDEDNEEADGEKKKKPEKVDPKRPHKKTVKEERDLALAKSAGIRKVRLGTFEDTGKCKGWAFVDFHLTEQALRALINTRNHSLSGRDLKVEFASAEAVRRGQLGTKNAPPLKGVNKSKGRKLAEREKKRVKSGAALATAQRSSHAIVTDADAPKATKVVFGDD